MPKPPSKHSYRQAEEDISEDELDQIMEKSSVHLKMQKLKTE